MLSFVSRRITFANVAMTLALVLAMSGGAFAAGKFLVTSTKQISPKVLKSLQGKAGPAGAVGAQGAAGPAGPQGPSGPAGPAGTPGAKGEAGPEGKEGKVGKDGKAGVTGSPWTAGGTLPSGKTETGTWSFGPVESSAEATPSIASFPIPLAAPLSGAGCEEEIAPCQVHFINQFGKEVVGGKEKQSGVCTGNVAAPTAAPGNLCVYAAELNNVFIQVAASERIKPVSPSGIGAGTTGAVWAGIFKENPGGFSGYGTWAVTAE